MMNFDDMIPAYVNRFSVIFGVVMFLAGATTGLYCGYSKGRDDCEFEHDFDQLPAKKKKRKVNRR